jgi:hypothetical protein
MERRVKPMRRMLVAILIVFALATIADAREIEGVQVPDTMSAGDQTLVLNGAGVRTKYLMDLYVGGLYLKQKSQDAKAIIAADEPMAIRLDIISGLITSEKMTKTTEEGFVASTGGNTAPIQAEIDSFIALFKDGIKKGDVYELLSLPGKGVESYKNGKLVATVPGLEFKKALFGIWLCNKSLVNASLKKGMLGQ